MACCYELSKSSSEEHLMDAEVSGYRFQSQIQRHVLDDTEASGREKEDTWEAELTKRQTIRDAVDWG